MKDHSEIRFAIVGCGVIAPTHAAALSRIEGVRLVSVFDTNLTRATEFARKFDTETSPDSAALFARDDIDVVSVCTPSGTHADIAVRAMNAGKHVIVEKPMEVTPEACDRIIEAQRNTGKLFTVISQHRWDRATQIVKDAIVMGKLGRILLADATVKWFRKQSYYDSGDWRGTWEMDGGGALMNQGVHTVDLLLWLAGEVESITAKTRLAAHERIEVEDLAVALIEYKSGAVGTLTATTATYPGFPVRIGIYGTEGSAVIEGDRLRALTLTNGETYTEEEAAAHALSVAQGGSASVEKEAQTRETSADPGAVWGDSHQSQIEDFVQALRTGGSPLISAEEGKRAVEFVCSVYASAKRSSNEK